MAIAYRAEPSVGCTFDVWDGTVTDADVREHLIHLAGDRGWPAGCSHLSDLTTLTGAVVPDSEVLDALYEGTHLSADLRVAVLVPEGFPSDVDLRYATTTEQLEPRRFTELGAACAYLAIDEARARALLHELRTDLHRTTTRR